ncbi:MAG TPA: signal peptidase II [Firmicutes bacterium]|nr:signal peptidase II [Bacillota bacterium]
MRFLLCAAAVLALDQFTKALAERLVPPGAVRSVIPGLLQVRPAANFGAAFGLLPHRTELFIAVAVVALGLIVRYHRRLTAHGRAGRLGLTLAAGGALGNLLDRLRFGYVRDFFDVRGYPAIFNVADLAIVVGTALILLALWREEAR